MRRCPAPVCPKRGLDASAAKADLPAARQRHAGSFPAARAGLAQPEGASTCYTWGDSRRLHEF